MKNYIEIRYPRIKKTYLVEASSIKNYCVSCNSCFKNSPKHYAENGNYCDKCTRATKDMVRIELKLMDAYKKRNYKLINVLEAEKRKVVRNLPRRIDICY